MIELHNCDCLDFMRTMPDKSVDAVITDPPYKISQMYGGGVDADNLMAVSSIFRTLPEIDRILKPSGFAVICYDNRILPFLFEAVKGTELIYRKQVFLYRRWGIANRWVGWMQTTDPICIFVKGHNKPFSPKIKGKVKHDCYIKAKPESETTGHPAQKPLEMFEDFVIWCSNEGDTIFDPYMGSCTTGIACLKHDRNFIGIDNNESYFNIAERRIAEAQLQMRLPI
jgi:site-specific DNA-methyltransferase (adenine-specific)